MQEWPHEWVVRFAVTVDEDVLPEKAAALLPEKFPFVVDDASGVVCEPVLLFLYAEYAEMMVDGPVDNTVRAYAYDLREWWVYLEEFEISWHAATELDLSGFCQAMRATISPMTGMRYATTTIIRRKTTVEQFYVWAAKSDICKGVDVGAETLIGMLQAGAIETPIVELQKTADEKQHVSVMQLGQAKVVMEQLGPLPSTNKCDASPFSKDWTSSRDRLAGEIALNAGLRISEVRNLKTSQFEMYVRRVDISQTAAYKIRVTGKGRTKKPVNFSGELILQIVAYIKGERAAIEFGLSKVQSNNLLLNAHGKTVGKPPSVRTLERNFSSACIRAGCFRSEMVEEFNLGPDEVLCREAVLRDFPLFVFHDLRHTFAVWTYYARKKAGDAEPWLYIQQQLRHKNLETTIKEYLASAMDFEALVTDNFMTSLNETLKV